MAYRRKKRARKPAQLHQYEVTYVWIGGEVMHEVYRIKCRKLTPAIMRSKNPLVGEVSIKLGPKAWTNFSPGALPSTEHGSRSIREIVEPVISIVPAPEKA